MKTVSFVILAICVMVVFVFFALPMEVGEEPDISRVQALLLIAVPLTMVLLTKEASKYTPDMELPNKGFRVEKSVFNGLVVWDIVDSHGVYNSYFLRGQAEKACNSLNAGHCPVCHKSVCDCSYPVVYVEGEWWFWDETWSSRIGPFTSREDARTALSEYAKTI